MRAVAEKKGPDRLARPGKAWNSFNARKSSPAGWEGTEGKLKNGNISEIK